MRHRYFHAADVLFVGIVLEFDLWGWVYVNSEAEEIHVNLHSQHTAVIEIAAYIFRGF